MNLIEWLNRPENDLNKWILGIILSSSIFATVIIYFWIKIKALLLFAYACLKGLWLKLYKKPLVFVQCHDHHYRWSPGNETTGQKRCLMHVHGRWSVFNNSETPTYLALAMLNKGKAEGVVSVKSECSNLWGDFPILPSILSGRSSQIDILFTVYSPFCKLTEDFESKVTIIDNQGRRHKLEKILFKFTGEASAIKMYLPIWPKK